MENLIFCFEREWVMNKRGEFGNPTRKLEKLFKQIDIKLVKSDVTTITVAVEDDQRIDVIKQVANFVHSNFGGENPWTALTVNGHVRGIEEFLREQKAAENFVPDSSAVVIESKVVEPKQNQTGVSEQDKAMADSGEAKETEKKPDEKVAENTESTKSPEENAAEEEEGRKRREAREAERKAAMEKELEEIRLRKEKEAEEAKAAETAKIQTIDAVIKDSVEHICSQMPVKYSNVMEKYIRELGDVIPMLSKMHANECIWSQNLLVSIDSGFGYSLFLKAIAKIFTAYELVDGRDEDKLVRELKIGQKASAEQKYSDWDKALDFAERFSDANSNTTKKCVILSLDVNEWQTELATEKVREYLRKINEKAHNFICVFRVAFTEVSVLKTMGDTLADIISVRPLSVPPVSTESMVDYLKEGLKKLNCSVEQGCDAYLEQWILKEKSDDSFYGYRTLDKMVRELIYQKAILNCANGTTSRSINEADMKSLLEEPQKERDPYEVLNELIGITQVKQQIREIMVQIKTQKELAAQGHDVDRPCVHMMFTGNPGTGKTTVARILARIMKEEGVLRKGLFFEIQGRNLCGRYVGETAPKTSAYCRDAYGSVLFIDEAYGLYQQDNGKDYGREAVQTLVAEMENHRDDLCVILAGYKKEMYDLMKVNPGLKSRIPFEIEFPNYTRNELEEIFFMMLGDKFEYGDSFKEALHLFFESLSDEVLNSVEFSNARFVRNLFERVWGKAAYRRAMDGEEKIIIQKEDLDYVTETAEFKGLLENKAKQKIGFSYE